jgi:hypothetical protein
LESILALTMKIAFITLPISRNFKPETTLARTLAKDGTAYAVPVIDFLEARLQLSLESEGAVEEAEIAPGHRKAVYWLISLAALGFLLVALVCLLLSATPRAAGADQPGLGAEGVPIQGEVTFGQAIQTLSARR